MRQHATNQACWCRPEYNAVLQMWMHQDDTVPKDTVYIITDGVVMDSQEPVIRDVAEGGVEYPGDLIAVKTLRGMPKDWLELIQAIALMSNHATNEISPFWCEHDTLHVCADENKFTNEEIRQLEAWGFYRDEVNGGFNSFKYGSA